jgi:hypothetical protein
MRGNKWIGQVTGYSVSDVVHIENIPLHGFYSRGHASAIGLKRLLDITQGFYGRDVWDPKIFRKLDYQGHLGSRETATRKIVHDVEEHGL